MCFVGNNNCPIDQYCKYGKCTNPCHEKQCGKKAQCRVENHKPRCYCPHGQIGNPSVECHGILVKIYIINYIHV